LFIGQFFSPYLLGSLDGILPWRTGTDEVHLFFVGLYLLFSVYFIIQQRDALSGLWVGLKPEYGTETLPDIELQPLKAVLEKATARPPFKR